MTQIQPTRSVKLTVPPGAISISTMPAGIDADVTDGAGSLSAGTTGTNPSASAQRMAALGFGWADVTATQVYTIFDIHQLLADEFVRRGAIPGGLTWHFARPPVQGLDFEVDVRGVADELVI